MGIGARIPHFNFDQVYVPFRPIGVVRSPYKERFGTPRQPHIAAEARGEIHLSSRIGVESLSGLGGFSHLWILFLFHRDEPVLLESVESSDTVASLFRQIGGKLRRLKTKVHPPRLNGKSIGVFASRSPHRPNPIGLSCVQLEKVEGRTLFLKGLDLIDGTPVLDIKPYLKEADSISDARSGWVEDCIQKGTPQIKWAATADLNSISAADLDSIEKILSQDPRPVCYREGQDGPDPYTARYGFFYGDWNIVYRSELNDAEQVFTIERIERVR